MNNPEEWEKLIAGYVLGDLTTEEVAVVHQLLALHPELLSEVDQLQEVLALIPLALPEDYPTSQLRSQILKNANLQEAQSEFPELDDISSVPISEISPIKKPLYLNKPLNKINKTYLVGLIFTTLLVGLGFDSYRSRQQLAIAQRELSGYQEAIAV